MATTQHYAAEPTKATAENANAATTARTTVTGKPLLVWWYDKRGFVRIPDDFIGRDGTRCRDIVGFGR